VHGMRSIGLLYTNTDWLNHWNISSKEQLAKLKKDPFNLTKQDQVKQTHRALCRLEISHADKTKKVLTVSKANELMCLLNGHSNGKGYLYNGPQTCIWPMANGKGNVIVKKQEYLSDLVENLVREGSFDFSMDDSNHYVPAWAIEDDQCWSTQFSFTTLKQLVFHKSPSSTSADKKKRVEQLDPSNNRTPKMKHCPEDLHSGI
jgi:hypothetical protein